MSIISPSIQLSKKAVQQIIEPYIHLLGRTDRDRIKSLIGIIQNDGRILLSDALTILYPSTTAEDYEPALGAFRQFRLRLKKFIEQNTPINFTLKSDTQTRTKPNQRWCWFEGDDLSIEDIATFSNNTTHFITKMGHVIQQLAAVIKFEDSLSITNESFNLETSETSHTEVSGVIELLEKWVHKKEQPYCALLGEYGMGKTITCMRFTKHLLEKRKTHPNLPLPIYLDLRNLAGKEKCSEMSLVDILASLLHNSLYGSSHLEKTTTPQDIIQMVREKGTFIIFDGLDEVLVHLSPVETQSFTHKLLSILESNNDDSHPENRSGKLLFSCRTHYFRTLREQKNLFTNSQLKPIPAKDYCVLTLLPLNTQQIRSYLEHTLPHININGIFELIKSIHNLSELAERPYTLSLIPSMISQIEYWKKEGSTITGVTLYRHMVLSWLERDSGKHKLTSDHKQQLMEHLAAELHRSGQTSWTISDLEQWFVSFMHNHPEIGIHYTFGKNENRIYRVMEMLKEDLRTATFLVRVGDSNFRFAHTSLLEFFLATYLFRSLEKGDIEKWEMPLVSKETLDFLGQMLSEKNNTRALTTLTTISSSYRPKISELAFSYMLLAQNYRYPTPELSCFQLEGADLRGWTISGKPASEKTPPTYLNLQHISFKKAHLEGTIFLFTNLTHADFSDAYLDNAEFRYSDASYSCFKNAHLTSAILRKIILEQADFSDASIKYTEWAACELTHTKGLHSNKDYCQTSFSFCEPAHLFQSTSDIQLSPSLQEGHHNAVNQCNFSPDGRYLVSASWDNTLRIWDAKTSECLRVLIGHQGWVHDGVFSPDGSYVASAAEDKTLRIWDSFTGECIRELTGHSMMVRRCFFSPNGQHLVSASLDKTLIIWDVKTGAILKILKGHQGAINHCAYSPEGDTIASVSDDQTVKIWDAITGECLHTLEGHQDLVRTCAYSSDGKMLASGSVDKTLRIWDSATQQPLLILDGHENRVRDCRFSPDDKYLASASEDHTLRIWDAHTGACLHILEGHQAKVKGCGYSPDGEILASVSDDRTIRFWDMRNFETIKILGSASPH